MVGHVQKNFVLRILRNEFDQKMAVVLIVKNLDLLLTLAAPSPGLSESWNGFPIEFQAIVESIELHIKREVLLETGADDNTIAIGNALCHIFAGLQGVLVGS